MEEVRYFGRISIYALIVGVVYWFLSHEAAGTALLIGFGLATGAAFLVLRSGAPHAGAEGAEGAESGTAAQQGRHADERPAATLVGEAGGEPMAETAGPSASAGPDEPFDPARPDGPFADESGPVPTRSAAPLAVGFGIAAMALAGAFGPWFLIAGAVPLLLGAVDWLRAADRELELRSSVDDALAIAAERDGMVARPSLEGVDSRVRETPETG